MFLLATVVLLHYSVGGVSRNALSCQLKELHLLEWNMNIGIYMEYEDRYMMTGLPQILLFCRLRQIYHTIC